MRRHVPILAPVLARMRIGATVTVVVSLMLTGCGVRGPLEAPPGALTKADERAQADSGQGKKENAAPKPHQGFILDGLIR